MHEFEITCDTCGKNKEKSEVKEMKEDETPRGKARRNNMAICKFSYGKLKQICWIRWPLTKFFLMLIIIIP